MDKKTDSLFYVRFVSRCFKISMVENRWPYLKHRVFKAIQTFAVSDLYSKVFSILKLMKSLSDHADFPCYNFVIHPYDNWISIHNTLSTPPRSAKRSAHLVMLEYVRNIGLLRQHIISTHSSIFIFADRSKRKVEILFLRKENENEMNQTNLIFSIGRSKRSWNGSKV